MKNIIYSLFMFVVAATALTACSPDNGTEPGNDSKPTVTLYQYEAESPLNPDNDLVFRIAANSKTQEAYYLIEKTADKEARGMSDEAYADYVVANGTKAPNINGSSSDDITVTGLFGNYTVTVVAVSGNTKTSKSFEFIGLVYEKYAEGTFTSEFFGDSWPQTLEYCAQNKTYRFSGLYVNGYNILFTVNGSTVTLSPNNKTETGYLHSKYGMVSVTPGVCTFEEANQTYAFGFSFTVAAGSFGDYAESYTITSKY